MADANISKQSESLFCGSCNTSKSSSEFYFLRGKILKPCKHCRKMQVRQWALRHPEARREACARYRSKHKDRANAASRAYNARHPERKRASAQKWIDLHPEKRKAAASSYAKRNLDKYNAAFHRRRARLAGNGGNHTPKEVEDLFAQQGARCANSACGKSILQKFHVDHIQPISKGGSDDISNIQLLCVPCNLKKHARSPEEWAAKNGLV